jgi:copper(I)-binding protein
MGMMNNYINKRDVQRFMRNIISPVFSLVLLISSVFVGFSFASEKSEIIVENGYVRESIPGTTISSAYMTLNNSSSKNLRLVAASSSVSERVEIHEHTMTGGLMRMRQRESVEILANDSTIFQPSGFHLMIFDLKQPLKAKENITITLHFDDQSSIDVNYLVKGLKQKKHHH